MILLAYRPLHLHALMAADRNGKSIPQILIKIKCFLLFLLHAVAETPEIC